MFRTNTHARPLGRWIVTSALIGFAGCGGGGEEAAPDPSATAEAPKAGPPTVKGLGSQAKERQGEMDTQAAGGAAPADPNAANRQAMMQAQGAGAAPGAAAAPADPNAANRQAMMQAQGATSGGRKGIEEREGPPPTGPGADAASAASGAGGGYVPGYAQSGSQGSGGPGGGPPPGVSFGAAPGPGGQAAAMRPPGGYGAPGTGAPGGSFAGGGGTGNSVLLAETAFLENGEALSAQTGAGGQAGGQPGFGGQGGPGGDLAKDDFTEPAKAVESFLSAASARDGERIGAAISRRAAGEAKAGGLKKIFTAAVERKLSDEDVANIAETFADYKVMNMTPGKTSGSLSVTIGREKKEKGTGKTERTIFERRIMRVHRDGNTGWKILDFGNRIVND